MHVEKVISGGETGVDRAALDVALNLEIPCGGYCPSGRWAEDGPIEEKYPLIETEEKAIEVRTGRNVVSSDGTLILLVGEPDHGTRFTLTMVRKQKRPIRIIDLDAKKSNYEEIATWIQAEGIKTLNIAGPRESSVPGIYDKAANWLSGFFKS